MQTSESTTTELAFAAAGFVGRARELQRVDEALDAARAGTPRVLLLAGEAGAGKSTMLAELFRRAEASMPPFACVVGECSSATGESDAYLPFREILKSLAGDSEGSKKVGAKVLGVAGKVLIDLAPDLIGIFLPGSKLLASVGLKVAKEAGWMSTTPAKKIAAEVEQEKIFNQYTEALRTIAQERPLVVALDDLQWADASSIALFFHLARKIKDAKLLLVGTYRPNDIALGRGGERHPLEQVIFELKRYFGDVVIDFSDDAADERRAFVDALLDSEPNALGEEFRTALLRHTEGHPLFTVELLRDLRERGILALRDGQWVVADDMDWEALPPRVEGVIAERVGRLEQELREILTVASVGCGTADFLAQIIVSIQQIDERRLLKLLSADLEKRHGLVLETGVRRRGRRILARYRFTHALVQRYLYGNLGEAEKMLLHGDVAALLEEYYEGETDQIATDLAYHYLQAGDAENALRYLEIALDQCLYVSGYREALVHANRALELISELPDTPERARHEFRLILRWAAPTKALCGWSSPDLKPRYDRARELLRHVGDDSAEATEFAFAVWTYYLVRCELKESWEMAEKCLEAAQRTGSAVGLLAAYTSLANSAFWSGDLAACTLYIRGAMEVYPTVDVQMHLLQYGMDTRVVVNEFDVWTACLEERFDDARKLWEEFLPQAEALKHPFSLAIALNTGAWMYQMAGDVAAARATAERLVDLATSHGFPSYVGLGTMLRGWAETNVDDVVAGFEQWRATAGPLIATYFGLLHADVLLRTNRPSEACAAIDAAIAFGEQHGERVFMPLLEQRRAALRTDLPPR
ncbi:MAG TPA: AAA family ATPase [Thermoanaerobaculia bacterium]|nr:AAA family ATPase [Thermoanaerobaculia bacterium]